MICPFPAGGGTDFIARLAAKHLSDRLGQQVYVENRGGANGAIGLQALMQSDPDGYTIAAISDGPMVANPALYDKLAYQPLRDFIPVAMMIRFPSMLIAHPSVGIRNVAELIALAKAKPGALTYSSGGTGNFSHLGLELLALQTGIKLLHVPYRGVGPATMALIGGDVQLMYNNVATALEHVRGRQGDPARSRRAGNACRRCLTFRRSPRPCPGFEMSRLGRRSSSRPRRRKTSSRALSKESRRHAQGSRGGEDIHRAADHRLLQGSRRAQPVHQAELEKWDRVIKTAGIKGD